jgi:hypothetical protein
LRELGRWIQVTMLDDGHAHSTAGGKEGTPVVLVLEGTADVIDGDTKVGELRSGDAFGAMVPLDESVAAGYVTATSPMRLLELNSLAPETAETLRATLAR